MILRELMNEDRELDFHFGIYNVSTSGAGAPEHQQKQLWTLLHSQHLQEGSFPQVETKRRETDAELVVGFQCSINNCSTVLTGVSIMGRPNVSAWR